MGQNLSISVKDGVYRSRSAMDNVESEMMFPIKGFTPVGS